MTHFRSLGARSLCLLLPCSVLALAVVSGCGDSGGEDDDGDGGTASGTAAGGSGFGVDTGATGGTSDGGVVELTDEQVAAILDGACSDYRGQGENLPSVIQFVVDVSGSMDDEAPGSDDTKWEVTREALRAALDTLPATTAVGVVYYPNGDVNPSETPQDVEECVDTDEAIPIAPLGAPGSDHRALIDQSLDDVEVGSYTPTHDAYQFALDSQLVTYESSARKFMLLITDGAPTLALGCVGEEDGGGGPGGGGVAPAPTEPIVDAVRAALADHDVRTFVIGSPGSEVAAQGDEDMRPWLSAAAIAGDTGRTGCDPVGPAFCHLDMTEEPDFAAALTEGLGDVVGQVVDECSFTFPDAAMVSGQVDPSLTNVIITSGAGVSSLVVRDEVGDCLEGWVLSADGYVTLCQATCDGLRADPGARVEIAFGCAADDIITVR